MSVEYNDTQYSVVNNKSGSTLNLSGLGITDIKTIKNLNDLVYLEKLDLSFNLIKEISGLDNLSNLKILNLQSNQIHTVGGLDSLTNLTILNLEKNPFTEISGFHNLVNLKKLNLGIQRDYKVYNPQTEGTHRVRPEDRMKVKLRSFGNRYRNVVYKDEFGIHYGSNYAQKVLFLNNREIYGVEKKIINDAKKIVAYCRVKIKKDGAGKKLLKARKEIEKLEGIIEKQLNKYQKMKEEAYKQLHNPKRPVKSSLIDP